MPPHLPASALPVQRPDLGDPDPCAAASAFLDRLSRPSTLLVAISGGSDSAGLLLALREANRAGRHRLVACTVDHALRPGSAEEAASVAARCRALGIPHEIARWCHSGITSAVQAQARLARYRLLVNAALSFSADLVVTGHTLDDQAETVAMRAARSPDGMAPGLAGMAPGLAGMADATLFHRTLWICRPFLGIRRQAVRDFLVSRGEGWIDDPSNDDPRFERIRLRRATAGDVAVVPPDRAGSSAAVARHLTRSVQIHQALVAEIALSDIAFDDRHWRRLITILTATLGGRTHGMGRETAERVLAARVLSLPGATTAGRVVFERRGGRLFLYRERRDLPTVAIGPGETLVWDGRFTARNDGPADAVIRPGAGRDLVERLVAGGVPEGVAGRVVRSAPAASTASVGLAPVIAPYDTVLPRFDLMIAQSIAALFGRAPYPLCPVDDISTK